MALAKTMKEGETLIFDFTGTDVKRVEVKLSHAHFGSLRMAISADKSISIEPRITHQKADQDGQ